MIQGALKHSRRMFAAFGIVLIGIWLFSLLVKLSVDLFQLRLCVECAAPRAGKWAAPVGALLIAGLSVSICSLRGLQQLFYSAWFFFPFTLICAFVVPSFLLLFMRCAAERKMGERGRGESVQRRCFWCAAFCLRLQAANSRYG